MENNIYDQMKYLTKELSFEQDINTIVVLSC